MNRNILFFSCILTIMVMCSCGNQNNKTAKVENVVINEVVSDEKQKSIDKQTILFFGNSLTAGYMLDPSESFPSLIEDTINTLGLDYKVINAGLSGETTSGGLNRIDWVLRQKVDVFVLELGANDMLRGMPLEETKSNLKAIMTRVKDKYPAAKIILAQMMAAPNMGEDYAQSFDKIYKDLAKTEKVLLMPFFLQDVIERPDLIMSDGKHPNAEGQKVVAKFIWGYLKDHL